MHAAVFREKYNIKGFWYMACNNALLDTHVYVGDNKYRTHFRQTAYIRTQNNA